MLLQFLKKKILIAVALCPKVAPIFHSTALKGKLVNVCHCKFVSINNIFLYIQMVPFILPLNKTLFISLGKQPFLLTLKIHRLQPNNG